MRPRTLGTVALVAVPVLTVPSSTPATPVRRATPASPWEAAAPAEAVEPPFESARRRVDAHLPALVDAGALAPDEIETAWLLERLAEEGGDLDGDDLSSCSASGHCAG